MSNPIKPLDKKAETRSKLIVKLFPSLRKNGLQSASMEEIAKIMEISRATLYKYFSTKEEIISYIITGFVEYIRELSFAALDSDSSFGTRFQLLFEQSVSLVTYFTDTFLKELEISYPEWYDRLDESLKQREEQLLAYYEEGIRRGIFNPVNGKLLIMQDEILRGMLNVKYLMTNQMTVHQILQDFYQLKKIQLFKPDKFKAVDDSSMMPKIDYLANKISKNLF